MAAIVEVWGTCYALLDLELRFLDSLRVSRTTENCKWFESVVDAETLFPSLDSEGWDENAGRCMAWFKNGSRRVWDKWKEVCGIAGELRDS